MLMEDALLGLWFERHIRHAYERPKDELLDRGKWLAKIGYGLPIIWQD